MIFAIFITIFLAAFAFLAWRNQKIALFALAGLLPVYLIRFSIGPIPSTLLEGMILELFVVWIIKKGYRNIPLSALKPWASPILLLLAAACLGAMIAPDLYGALGILKAYYFEAILVLLMSLSLLKKPEDRTILFSVLAISGMMASLFAIFQYATGMGIPEPWDLERRITGWFDYPNALGLFLAPITAFSFIFLFSKEKHPWFSHRKQVLIFWASSAILCGTAIILAKTEAAFIAIPFALIVTTLAIDIHPRKKWYLALTAAVIFAALFLAFPAVQEKVLLLDDSGLVRRSQWQETLQMLLDHPFFGAGLNAYPQVLEPYHDPTLYEIFQYPHNILLNIWSELGVIGIIASIWFLVLITKSLFREPRNIIKIAAFAAIMTMVIHGLVDVPFMKNDLSIFTSLLLGLLIL
ncbi:MAG: O-antigen ligase family protein [Patescibacteria group bacterium]|jgi:O-antigen ligase